MRLLAFLLCALCAIRAQDAPVEPAKLTLPAAAKPAIPKPKVSYTAPAASKWDTPLLYSQLALASAGTGATVASQVRAYQDPSTAAALSKVGVVGLSIVLQRAYNPVMSDRTKKWLSIANFVAAGVLAGLAGQDVQESQTALQSSVPTPTK